MQVQNPSQEQASSSSGLAEAAPVRFVRNIIEAITVLGVATYSILICLQVFYRYALNSSLVWSEEIVQFILMWTVMLGSAIATDRGAHIVLDPLHDHLGAGGRRLKNIAVELGTMAFCCVLVWYGVQLCYRTRFMSSSATDVPMWWVYASMPVGGVLILFFALVHMLAGTERTVDPMDDRS